MLIMELINNVAKAHGWFAVIQILKHCLVQYLYILSLLIFYTDKKKKFISYFFFL